MTPIRARAHPVEISPESHQWWLPALAGLIAVAALVALSLARVPLDRGIAVGVILGLAIGSVARPRWGFYLLLFAVVLSDLHLWEFSPITERLGFYVFQNWRKILSDGDVRRFGYLVANTVEVFLLAIALGTILRMIRTRARPLLGGDVILAMLYLATVAAMLGYGVLTGGGLKPALWQVRPFIDFVILAVLGAQLLETADHVRAAIWALASASVIKAIQIVWIFVVEAGARFGHWREILGHEDAVFLAAILVLAFALALYGTGGWQRWVLIASAPVVLAALVVNLRRAGYASLALSVLLAPVLLHGRRRRAALSVLALVALFALYGAVAWSHPNDTLAAPFQKAVSIVAPETGSLDHTSNLYRVRETLNLRRTIMAHPLGLGFGHPFDVHLRLPDISFLVPHWQYHPHNAILGIWMSLGTPGFVVFSMYMASLMMLAGHALRRHTDPYLKAVSFFLLTSLIAALFVGAVDQFIWMERGGLFLGALAAMVSTVYRRRPDPDGASATGTTSLG